MWDWATPSPPPPHGQFYHVNFENMQQICEYTMAHGELWLAPKKISNIFIYHGSKLLFGAITCTPIMFIVDGQKFLLLQTVGCTMVEECYVDRWVNQLSIHAIHVRGWNK